LGVDTRGVRLYNLYGRQLWAKAHGYKLCLLNKSKEIRGLGVDTRGVGLYNLYGRQLWAKAHGYKFCLLSKEKQRKENSESTLSRNNEAISNATEESHGEFDPGSG